MILFATRLKIKLVPLITNLCGDVRHDLRSNHHAKIHYVDKNFYLVDDSSSNGTHTYLRAPLKIERGKETIVRIGRSTIRIQTTDYWKARIDPSIHFLKQGKEVRNPNYEGEGGDEEDIKECHYRQEVRDELSFFDT